MGRPRKSEMGPVPTRERILETTIELFAKRGVDAVSVRDITGALGLNEASLYNHFRGKADLLDAIFKRLDERLIAPGFRNLPPEFFSAPGPFDLADFLINGAKRFFSHADRITLLTWRILISNEYLHAEARDSVKEHLLDAPVRFFMAVFESMKTAGKLRADIDCASAGRIVAAIFFDYSFRSNLDAAWDIDGNERLFSQLTADLTAFAQGLPKY